MSVLKKKRGATEDEGRNGSAHSSYAQLKSKSMLLKDELDRVCKEGADLRREKEFIGTELSVARRALEVAQQKNDEVLGLIDRFCKKTEEEKSTSEGLLMSLREENTKLKQRLGLHHVRMEQLKRTITDSSDAYDALVQKCDLLEETIQRQVDEVLPPLNGPLNAHNRDTKRAVCHAFGWSFESADPVLLRAACAFWEGCCIVDHDGTERVSFKTRLEIWLEITFRGFKGEAMDVLEKAFRKGSKFDVVELARRSDVKSQFNATSVGAVSHCELGKKKYDRGLLCSDATLRRTQKRVLQLAKSLGFSTYPMEEEGKV
jgi:hypothetical protein